MDQQPNRSNPPTPEEIARLEAEAVRAMQQGEPLPAAPSGAAILKLSGVMVSPTCIVS